MEFTIRELKMADYESVMKLWLSTEGMAIGDKDSRSNMDGFLQRNPRLSFVAEDPAGEIVGALLCGHDGRRGYLHHLAVRVDCRRKGIGGRLVKQCLSQLLAVGIKKCHLFAFVDNHKGIEFWLGQKFQGRAELVLLSRTLQE